MPRAVEHNNNLLRIGSLNVHGLSNKLISTELETFISSYQLVCLTETFCISDDFEDPINDLKSIPGYKLIHKPRKNCIRPSGGICLAVHQNISKFISFVPNNSDYLLWCKIDKCVIDTDDDIYLACTYVPPESSNYVKASCYEEIENELLLFNKTSKYLLLTGDLNAHTGTKADIIQCDVIEDQFMNMQTENVHVNPTESLLQSLNIPLNRQSDDKHNTNNWGNKLIECCLNTGMCIVNGRFGNKSSRCTTTTNSVIDYFLGTPDIFHLINDMNVNMYDPCTSDIHIAIDVNLLNFVPNINNVPQEIVVPNVSNENEQGNEHFNIRPWEQNKSNEFIEHLDMTLLQSIQLDLDQFQDCHDKQSQLDSIMSRIGNMFVNAGTNTFGRKQLRNGRSRGYKMRNQFTPSKPWFTLACKKKKIIFNKARKNYQILRTPESHRAMIDASKGYKYETKKAHKNYRENIRTEVRNLRKQGNSQKYWDFIKNKTTAPSTNPRINFTDFVDFFRDVNATQHDRPSENEPTKIDVNEKLDKEISEREIREAVKKLKNRKAVGVDGIANEYIKASIDIFVSTYKRIFNIIFNESIMPKSWTEGIIKPIYKKKGDKTNPDNYRPISLLSCMGKLFASILNNRLTQFLEENKSIGEEQLGFRKNYSTIDGICILNGLLEMLTKRNKTLYCAFIDLKKCFGSIWREGLFIKLHTYNLGGKIMNILKSMYENVKSCVKMNYIDEDGNMIYNISNMFSCLNGLREGDILSPILFSLYVNDLKSYLEENNCEGVTVEHHNDNDEIFYLKMLMCMYADDTVLFANTKPQLQKNIECLQYLLQKMEIEYKCK